MATMSAEDRIAAVRTDLLFDYPFFGAIIVNIPIIEDVTGEITLGTMATDGRTIWWFRKFIMDSSKAELLFTFIHEICHIIKKHPLRMQEREHEKWNHATDYSINGELVEAKIGTMPKGCLLDAQYTGLSSEEIYAKMPDPPPQPSGGGGGKPGHGIGGILPGAPTFDNAAHAKAEAEIDILVRQAAMISAKNPGRMPGSLQKMLDKLLEPEVNWRDVVRRFIDHNCIQDYSFTRPNKRFLASGIIMPGLVVDGVHKIVFINDSSGSIFDVKAQTRMASEINAAHGDGNIDQVVVIYADAAVASVEVFERGDEVQLEPRGGGGTRFSPALAYVMEHHEDAACIIYFSDMECFDFGPEPPMPVLWAVYGDERKYEKLTANVPFGECIFVGQ